MWTGVAVAVAAATATFPLNGVAEESAAEKQMEREFVGAVRPLLERHCFQCHGKDVQEAEIDLAAFASPADMRRQTRVWLQVRRMLESGQMPPPDSPQPTDAEMTRLRQWVREFLAREAEARAGDPGPVILRRLNNSEYNYTVRDLTGVESLDPTREFPVDGAAGEGFTNAGAAQSMSPALASKYLDAAKEVASHAVLVPDGIRFSPAATRRDQTDELLARIQEFYRRFTADGGGSAVDLQGIKFETNQGGMLPVAPYLEALLEARPAVASGAESLDDVARRRSLNARYLKTLWQALETDPTTSPPSLLLDAFRRKWRLAKPSDAPQLAAEIARAQQALWKFNSVGQFGREGGPTSWMAPATPVIARQELRVKFPASPAGADAVLHLTAHDLGDGNDADFVVWERPRIEFPGAAGRPPQPPILLRDVRAVSQRAAAWIGAEAPRTALYLDAVAKLRESAVPESGADAPSPAIEKLASQAGLNAGLLDRWTKLVGLGPPSNRRIEGHYAAKMVRGQGYEAINGWGFPGTPSLLTNQSKEPISFLTLTVPARSVVVHPSPTQDSVVAWRSPLEGRVQIAGLVADADSQCGNGVAWRLELRAESGASILAQGTIDNGQRQQFQPPESAVIQQGDVVALIVAARDNQHSCDTTHVALKLSEVGAQARTWDLAADVVDRVLESNPLSDSYANPDVWHFCATGGEPPATSRVPAGSSLEKWRAAVGSADPSPDAGRLALAVQNALTADDPGALSEPDRLLRELLRDWNGPLRWTAAPAQQSAVGDGGDGDGGGDVFALDAASFGSHPSGAPIAPESLCLQAPHHLAVRLPAALIAGAEFVVAAELHATAGEDGSVQLAAGMEPPTAPTLSLSQPILVRGGAPAKSRVEASLSEFRNLFPSALCYARIVPVDEVVTLALYYREDDHLKRLMLDETQIAELDRLWDELYYVSQEPLKLAVAFEQISEFATQDRPDLVTAFAPSRKPINDRAEAFRQREVQTEPNHVRAAIAWTDRAWRRPLTDAERQSLQDFYAGLRSGGISHEPAIQLLLARVLTSPTFLYRQEQPGPGEESAPVSSHELASRLSYFLWSTLPDETLRGAADSGQLTSDATLQQQTRRMLRAPRTRRLAVEFACQWLHLRNFDQNDDKNEQLYPEFAALRGDMYEETVRFFEDMFCNDGSILGLLDADHTFVNEPLARHYEIPWESGAADWRRVDGVQAAGRGGVLGMATFLASQSGASRTSPILRGNWLYETLLGERLPRPPANVPQLPEAVPNNLTARQLIEQHSSAPQCAKCHSRIDPYGFALEQYDAIGRRRSQPVDTKTKIGGQQSVEGLGGLRDYLLKHRRDAVVRQFCRKLLGFALGREVQLSDEPLLADMQRRLEAHEHRFSVAVEAIVASRQFREIRGQQATEE